ncbi:hypothetical protein CU098_001047, partial [Rhizopus stolonifer]
MSKSMIRKYRKALDEYSDVDIMSNDSLSKQPRFGRKRSKKRLNYEYKFTVDPNQPTDAELNGVTLS